MLACQRPCREGAPERDTRPCNRGPDFFTNPEQRHIFRAIPLCGTGGPRGEQSLRMRQARSVCTTLGLVVNGTN
eukprot:scaffold3412_cov124-Isochrysis_galbana.AAC.3